MSNQGNHFYVIAISHGLVVLFIRLKGKRKQASFDIGAKVIETGKREQLEDNALIVKLQIANFRYHCKNLPTTAFHGQ